MPKTDFENIEPLKRYRRQTDRAIDRATDRQIRHSHKGVPPLNKQEIVHVMKTNY
jgi:hypothetical protein